MPLFIILGTVQSPHSCSNTSAAACRAQHASFWDSLKGSLTCPVLWRFFKALYTAAGRTPHLSLGMGHDRSSLATNWPWPQRMPLCPSASRHMRIRKAGCWIHSATCQSTCKSAPAAPNLRAQQRDCAHAISAHTSSSILKTCGDMHTAPGRQSKLHYKLGTSGRCVGAAQQLHASA